MTSGARADAAKAASDRLAGPYRWMAPAIWLDRIRPGLRAATFADAARLRELPRIVGSVLLPLLAVILPAALSVLQSTTQPSVQGDPYDAFALVIYDVFTESVPFMVAAAAIGLMAPAAGVLIVLTYGVGNVAATLIAGELTPVLPALFGRFVSFGILWLLIVEIPLAGRYVVEWWIDSATPRPRRLIPVGIGALSVLGLVEGWVLATPALITAVFFLTSIWGAPFLRSNYQIAYAAELVVIPIGIAAAVLIAVRYGGRDPHVAAQDGRVTSGLVRFVRRLLGVLVALALLSGFISEPIDVAILAVSLILSPPLARFVLRRTRIAPFLARVPWPARLLAGFATTVAFSVPFIQLVGASDVSRWFNTVIAIAISYAIIAVFLGADEAAADLAREKRSTPPMGSIVATVFGSLLVVLAFPGLVLADGTSSQPDTDALRSALAAAGAATLLGMLFPPLARFFRRPPAPPPPPPLPDPAQGSDRDLGDLETSDGTRLRDMGSGPPKPPPVPPPPDEFSLER